MACWQVFPVSVDCLLSSLGTLCQSAVDGALLLVTELVPIQHLLKAAATATADFVAQHGTADTDTW